MFRSYDKNHTRRYSEGLKDLLSRMKVEDKGKLNNPMKDGEIQNAIFIMVFHTVQCDMCSNKSSARKYLKDHII